MAWTFWPLPFEQESFAFSSLYIEGGQMAFGWPSVMRQGQSEAFSLRLETNEMLVVVESDDGATLIPLSELASEFNPVFEARLELTGSEIFPSGALRASLAPGQRGEYIWNVKPLISGSLDGRLWLYLDLVPISGNEDITVRYPVLARPLEIESQALMGLGVVGARWLGGILILASISLLLVKPHNMNQTG